MKATAIIISALAIVPGISASAQTAAPTYYVEALFAVSTAEQLANFCPQVSMNLQATNEASETLLARLSADGIEGNAITELTGVEAAVADLQAQFVETYGLDDDPTEEVLCNAALSEIEQESAVGEYLMEVSQ